MRKVLLLIEVTAIVVTVLLAVMWIISPSHNWEPWIVLSGVVSIIVEVFRRRSSSSNEEELQSKPSEPSKIRQLHSEKYAAQELGVLEATNTSLDAFAIKSDCVRTTGGSTGVRVWVSESHPSSRLESLHDEIVALHGQPIALDVLDYVTEKVLYRANRPPMGL